LLAAIVRKRAAAFTQTIATSNKATIINKFRSTIIIIPITIQKIPQNYNNL